ncbi:ABC transporter ATP-binding protein/permease [Gloeothece verrucosa]|uniref:ABC transporter domain protein n=1 Tax=Gloeothece verrucosa (strain PCC 7822) TaxID=497965 RepID=E0ULK4_GLOV7|nr:ABC transporter ATP-binding protein/permease [Gloeothece verrucosa]ADN17834.1 ABC transporter domain protein [Gloeothece verrucosa PCC 7822]
MNLFNRQFWYVFWHLTIPYWFSEEKWGARALLMVLLLLVLSVNGVDVYWSFINRDFMTALANKNTSKFFYLALIYIGSFVIMIPLVVFYTYFQQKLRIYWRRWLTCYFLDKYFSNRNFYTINYNSEIDNPDERISQDIEAFTIATLEYFLKIIESIITLISFLGILYSISFSLVIIVIVYVFLGSFITILLGKKLIKLNFKQLQKEANFRYQLIYVRNHSEMIAFFMGEKPELKQIKKTFNAVFKNLMELIGWQRNLRFFTVGYNYFHLIIPSLVIAPLYFNGKVEFGVITQANLAFAQILSAFSLIVRQFDSLSAFIAQINRLGSFLTVMNLSTQKQQQEFNCIHTQIDNRIAIKEMTLLTPDYKRTLIKHLSFTLEPASDLLIWGPSGCGKSSLLRAIAGLDNAGTGLIIRPDIEQMLFLPQRPYMILGTLRDQLLYPYRRSQVKDEELQQVLQQVNLQGLEERFGGFDVQYDWRSVLSVGEQQRVNFARILLNQPDYVILDEATSALDLKNEKDLYKYLKDIGITFISTGHRPSLLDYHDYILELQVDSSWRWKKMN